MQKTIARHWRVKALAGETGLCREAVRLAVERGELKAVRYGRAILIPEDEARRWIASFREYEPRARQIGGGA